MAHRGRGHRRRSGPGPGPAPWVYMVEANPADPTQARVWNRYGALVLGYDEWTNRANWAFANLTAGRTYEEEVVFVGSFLTDASSTVLTVYGYTIADLYRARFENRLYDGMFMTQPDTNEVTHIKVLGGIIDHGPTSEGVLYHCIYFPHITDSLFRDIEITNGRGSGGQCAIRLGGVNAAQDVNRTNIESCRVIDNAYGLVHWYAYDSKIVECTVDGLFKAQGKGIDVNYGGHCVYSDNNILNCGHSGILIWESPDNVIANNTSRSNGRAGIEIALDSDRCVVDGNHCSGNGTHGIYLQVTTANEYVGWPTYCTLSENHCYLNGQSGILVESSSVGTILKANECYLNDDHGISVLADDCIIEGNILTDNGADGDATDAGIKLNTANYVIVSENQLRAILANHQPYGILVDGNSDYNDIHDNYTRGHATAGIRIHNVNCNRNLVHDNDVEEGAISDIGTATHAWLNWDPSANAFVVTIAPPVDTGGDSFP